MQIVITGSTGLLGQHIIEYCNRTIDKDLENSKILALGRNKIKLDRLTASNVKSQYFDLTSEYGQYNILDEWGGENSIWIHCAAALSGADQLLLNEINIKGTEKLIRKAQELRIGKFILISSIAVYGINHEKTNGFVENDGVKPASKYGKSKLKQEELLQKSSLNWIIIRPPFIGGPGDENFLVELSRRIRDKKMPSFTRTGTIGYIDARDLAKSIIKIAINPVINNEVFNIQSKKIKLDDFIKMLADCINEKPPYGKHYPYYLVYSLALINDIINKITGKSGARSISRYRIRSLTTPRFLNTNKIQEMVGFQAEYSIKTSILDWVTSNQKP